LIWFDQRHLPFWIKLPQGACAAGTAKAAAYHDNPCRALREQRTRPC
jgi:hypothetical protein